MVVSRKQRGFTLIEMLIVISMILILLSVAIPYYRRSIVLARETVLKDDLYTLRRTIEEYTYDKKRAPESLDALVTDGYLHQIPPDPMTNLPNWQVETEDANQAIDQNQLGIGNVHSTSNRIGTDGAAYNAW